jgi:hypothetical protein
VHLVLNNGEVVELKQQIVSDNPESGEEVYTGRDKQDVFWWTEAIFVTPMAGRTDLVPFVHEDEVKHQ